jgi:hypothetical protein
MQSVALRWQMDAGVVPVVHTGWGVDVGAPFGFRGATPFPAADKQLFQAATFLDESDAKVLAALC